MSSTLPLKRLARLAEGTLFLMGAVHLLSAVVSVWSLKLFARIEAGEEISQDHVDTVMNLAEQADTAYVVGLLVAAIAFMAWFHRAYQNVSKFASAAASYPTGAAVYGWIIPFVNLVRPYQIASEIWVASKNWTAAAPAADGGIGAHLIDGRGSSPMVKLWWVTWIVSGIVGTLLLRGSTEFATISDYTNFNYTLLVVHTLRLVAAGLAVALVARITGWQDSMFPVARATVTSDRTGSAVED